MSRRTFSSGSNTGISKRRSTTNDGVSVKKLRQEENRRKKEEEKRQLEEEECRKFKILKYNIAGLSSYIQKEDFHKNDRPEWGQLVRKLKSAENKYDQVVEASFDRIIQAQNKVDEQDKEIERLEAEIREIDSNENTAEGDKEKREQSQKTLEILQHAQVVQKRTLSDWKRKEKASEASLKKALDELKNFIHTFRGVRVPMDYEISGEEMVKIRDGIKQIWQCQ